MVNFSVDQIHPLMRKPDQIRNICVIAHVDHGKTTLIDCLLQAAGLISKEKAGSARYLDQHRDSKERGITIKSSGVSLYFTLDDAEPSDEQETKETPYLINLIDSPGHVDFSSEVTAALRVTDGAIVVVDCIEGVCVQTETVLRQAISERIKPVLFLNKLDRVFLERDEDPETSFQNFAKAIESVNVVISTYKDELLGDVQVQPTKGTIAFGSGYFGWAFTLEQFAAMYAVKFGVPKEKFVEKLWGDHFYDDKRKKWTKKPVSDDGRKLERGFCRFVLKPVRELTQAVMNDDMKALHKLLKGLGVPFDKEMQELKGKDLLRKIMKAWLPAERALLTMVTQRLPAPHVAQAYRVHNLYDGPMDDEAAEAIRKCDPEGPLMIYVSKMIPTSDSGRFIAFGRVFSGTAKAGEPVRIQGPNYVPGGSKTDLFVKKIQRTLLMLGQKTETLVDCPCGSIVGLVGVDAYLLKSGTITTIENAHNFKTMKYSVSPVVQVAVEPKNASDLSKLVEGLKRLAKYDPLVQVYTAKTGEHIVAGAGELHLEICLKDLVEDFMNGAPIKKSDPVVQYCESIGSLTAMQCSSKSPNKLNRVAMTAEPLGQDFCQAVERGDIGPDDDFKARARKLTEEYKWDVNHAKKIWSFGCPPDAIPNVLVDCTKGIQLLSEVKDSLVSAFSQATTSGVFIDGLMRGCRFNVCDMKIHSDPAHRGAAQMIPATKRAIFACQIKSSPKILEPVYRCSITTSSDSLSGVYATLNSRRGVVENQEDRIGTPLTVITALLPVSESFGFTELLRKNTSGKAFPHMTFSHWQAVSGDVYDKSSAAYEVVRSVRVRQGMKEELPAFDHFHDRL